MIIRICSRRAAEKMAWWLRQETAIISIVGTGVPKVMFASNPNIKAVFHMSFDDVLVPEDDKIPPVQDDFRGLKEFVDSLSVKVLLVHCAAGISRSAAVATAIAEYLGRSGNCVLVTKQEYNPNMMVYRFACKELGISPADAIQSVQQADIHGFYKCRWKEGR